MDRMKETVHYVMKNSELGESDERVNIVKLTLEDVFEDEMREEPLIIIK